MLTAPIKLENGNLITTGKGTPQGGIISPLLANIVLNELDHWIESQWIENPVGSRYVKRIYPNGNPDMSNGYVAMRTTRLKEMYIVDITLEFGTQIVRRNFLNYSANTGVSIRKSGNVEATPGTEICYTIYHVRNESTVPLTDFFWRDIIPTNAVRITRLVTGTYNQNLRYRVIATTNRGDTIVVADNLSTTRNNVIDFSNAALGLRNDEYITSFTLVFGTVRAGFASVEQPQVFVQVLPNLQDGLEFANRVDIGGRCPHGEWVIGNSVWRTRVRRLETLPRTGF